MADNLNFKKKKVKEEDPNYFWVNIELRGTMVGKVRIKEFYSMIIIKNINIFPEFERRGFARQTVNQFKQSSREIIADRVRDTARGFWKRMGFTEAGGGNYKWVSNRN